MVSGDTKFEGLVKVLTKFVTDHINIHWFSPNIGPLHRTQTRYNLGFGYRIRLVVAI